MGTNPNGRFQIIQQATALPGSCAICGMPNGPFIDFGLTLEFFGAVIFCFSCVKDAGRTAGLVDEKAAEVYTETAVYTSDLKEAIDELLNSYLSSAYVSSTGAYSLFGADVPAESSAEDSSGDINPAAATDGSECTDGQVDSTPIFQEPVGVPSDTGDVSADTSIFN